MIQEKWIISYSTFDVRKTNLEYLQNDGIGRWYHYTDMGTDTYPPSEVFDNEFSAREVLKSWLFDQQIKIDSFINKIKMAQAKNALKLMEIAEQMQKEDECH